MNKDKMKDDETERKKNLGKFEFKIGGRGNVQRMRNAMKVIDYIENLPSYKMFGVKKLSRGIIVLTKEEVVPKKKIEDKIKYYISKRDEYEKSTHSCEFSIRMPALQGMDACINKIKVLQELLEINKK